jgi:hypothetical protein
LESLPVIGAGWFAFFLLLASLLAWLAGFRAGRDHASGKSIDCAADVFARPPLRGPATGGLSSGERRGPPPHHHSAA